MYVAVDAITDWAVQQQPLPLRQQHRHPALIQDSLTPSELLQLELRCAGTRSQGMWLDTYRQGVRAHPRLRATAQQKSDNDNVFSPAGCGGAHAQAFPRGTCVGGWRRLPRGRRQGTAGTARGFRCARRRGAAFPRLRPPLQVMSRAARGRRSGAWTALRREDEGLGRACFHPGSHRHRRTADSSRLKMTSMAELAAHQTMLFVNRGALKSAGVSVSTPQVRVYESAEVGRAGRRPVNMRRLHIARGRLANVVAAERQKGMRLSPAR